MSRCVWYISKYATRPPLGMVGTRAFLLLREIGRMGHRPVLITSDSVHLNPVPEFKGSVLCEEVDGVTLRWLKTCKYKGAHSIGRILSWIDFELRLLGMKTDDLPRPDAIIASSLSIFTIFNGLRLRRKFGCRLVFEVRDIWPLTIIEEGGFSPRNPFVMALRWVEKLAYRRADLIVGTMPNLKQHVDESLGDRHAPVHCIPFGYERDMIDDQLAVSDDWAAANLPEGKLLVCHAGSIGVTNALEVLFECARLMKDDDRVQFVIVGDGYMRPHYEAACKDLPNVTFTGPVAKNMVQDVLRRCDLLYFSVQPSKVWNYGMSLNKIIDYMLAGKPIVASYTGYPTMVDEAGGGVSVPAGDAAALKAELLRQAALPRATREAMGQRGRAWLLEHRDYRKLASDYLELLAPAAATTQARSEHVRAA